MQNSFGHKDALATAVSAFVDNCVLLLNVNSRILYEINSL